MNFKDLKPGTVFKFTTQPIWWENTSMDWQQSMVAMGNGAWRYLDHSDVFYTHKHHDFKVLGKLTSELSNGKEWEAAQADEQLPPGTSFYVHGDPIFGLSGRVWVMCADGVNNAHCVDGGVIHPEPDWNIEIIQEPAQAAQAEEKPEELPIGTKFRFRSFPLRWTCGSLSVDSGTLFEVVNQEFTGEGQCIRATDRAGARWGTDDGVLPSDDIEIEIAEEQKPAQLSIGTRFRFRSWPECWRKEIAGECETRVVELDCGCPRCDTRIRTRVARFFKKIW